MFWASNIRKSVWAIEGVEVVSRCDVSVHISNMLCVPSIVTGE